MSRALLLHAADLLRVHANVLARNYARAGDWTGHPDAKADHDDHQRTASALQELADQSITDPKGHSHDRRSR